VSNIFVLISIAILILVCIYLLNKTDRLHRDVQFELLKNEVLVSLLVDKKVVKLDEVMGLLKHLIEREIK
jgi:hypothetical protein